MERLRNLQGTKLTPILVYSGLEAGRAKHLMPADADVAFMSKPGDPDELLCKVQCLLGEV
jgi:hypothetical protein